MPKKEISKFTLGTTQSISSSEGVEYNLRVKKAQQLSAAILDIETYFQSSFDAAFDYRPSVHNSRSLAPRLRILASVRVSFLPYYCEP